MSRQTLRIVLSAVAGLLIVPVAINIGTGGDAPPWLKPFADWLWPIAIACVALVIALELWDRHEQKGGMSVHRPNDPRNADLALTQVARYVTARQRGTLGEQLRIALALGERPDAVRQPTHLVQRVSGEEFRLSASLTIADVYAEMNESMLILGAPGAGKTTQLLDLAQALIAQAQMSSNPSIPVVLDLADWVLARRGAFRRRRPASFDAWILDSLARRYRTPERVGRIWLGENRLTLLFDGLDEVPEAEREQCATAINTLHHSHGLTRVAVCCREADYARLRTRLHLQGAVVIRPLDRTAVRDYLAALGPAATGVAAALEEDEQLWDLLSSPLMLAVVILAGTGAGSDTRALAADPAAQRAVLFDAYIVEVLARRLSNEVGHPSSVLRAIKTLARASASTDVGVRIAALESSTVSAVLPQQVKAVASRWIAPCAAMASALAWTWASAVHFGRWAALMPLVIGFLGLFAATFYSGHARIRRPLALIGTLLVAVALPVGLATGIPALYATSRWSLTLASVSVILLTILVNFLGYVREAAVTTLRDYRDVVTIAAVGVGAVLLLSWRPHLIQSWALSFALGTCLMVALVFASSIHDGDDRRWASSPTAWALRAIYVVAGSWPVFGGVVTERGGLPWESAVGILIGSGCAMFAGLLLMSYAIEAALIGAAMYIAGEPNPWRRRFQRFAADRSLLTYADGGYRFVHLLIRDHLAECEPERLGDAVVRRRAQLPERDLRPIGG